MTEQTTILEVLRREGTFVYTNVGTSMMPLLRQGKDLMVIRRREEPPKLWDAVLFERPNGQLIMHRIVKQKVKDGQNIYLILGDNCIAGEWMPEAAIHGTLVEIRRKGGKIIRPADLNYRLYLALWAKPYRLRTLLLKIKFKTKRALYLALRPIYRAIKKIFLRGKN